MKKYISKLVTLLPILVFCFLFAGCDAGGKVDTSLIVAEDMSGTRIIQVTLDSAVIKKYCNGTIEDIDSLIKSECPQAMSYSLSSNSDGENVMTFELSFTSPEDYYSKLATINELCESELYTGNTVWCSGIKVNENFNSRHLLGWLTTALVNQGFVESGNSGYILTAGKTTLTFGNSTVESTEQINYDNSSYVKVCSVDLFSDYNAKGKIDRKIIFHVDASTLGNKEKEIKSLFEEKVTSKAKVSTEDNNYYKDFVISASGVDEKTVAEINELLFKSGNLICSETEQGYFGIGKNYSETLNIDEYTYSAAQSIDIGCFVKAPEGVVVTDSEGRSLYSSYDYPEYYTVGSIYCQTGSDVTMEYSVIRNIEIRRLGISTTHKSENVFTKNITFATGETITNEEAERIVNKFTESLSKNVTYGDEKFQVKVSYKLNGDLTEIKISATGDRDDLILMTKTITGKDATLAYAERYLFIYPVYDEAVAESFDFSNCFVNKSSDFKMEYIVDLGILSRVDNSSEGNSEEVVLDGHKAVITKENGLKYDGVVTGYKVNLFILLSVLLFLTAIACILFAVIKTLLFDRRKEKIATMVQPVETVVIDAELVGEKAAEVTDSTEETVSEEEPDAEDNSETTENE